MQFGSHSGRFDTAGKSIFGCRPLKKALLGLKKGDTGRQKKKNPISHPTLPSPIPVPKQSKKHQIPGGYREINSTALSSKARTRGLRIITLLLFPAARARMCVSYTSRSHPHSHTLGPAAHAGTQNVSMCVRESTGESRLCCCQYVTSSILVGPGWVFRLTWVSGGLAWVSGH